MHPEPACLGFRRKTVTRAKIEQDVGGLSDHPLAGFQEWRRERWRGFSVYFLDIHHSHHGRQAATGSRDIGIVRAGLLEGEPDVFTAALDAGPVIEFVAHRSFLGAKSIPAP